VNNLLATAVGQSPWHAALDVDCSLAVTCVLLCFTWYMVLLLSPLQLSRGEDWLLRLLTVTLHFHHRMPIHTRPPYPVLTLTSLVADDLR
jgi:hypothetical protein